MKYIKDSNSKLTNVQLRSQRGYNRDRTPCKDELIDVGGKRMTRRRLRKIVAGGDAMPAFIGDVRIKDVWSQRKGT